jgi:hypothetical protein
VAKRSKFVLCMLSTNKGMSCPKGAIIGPANSQKSSLETVYKHIEHPVVSTNFAIIFLESDLF